jgi:hypothetical protein
VSKKVSNLEFRIVSGINGVAGLAVPRTTDLNSGEYGLGARHSNPSWIA